MLHSSAALQALLADVERNGYCFSDGVGIISPLLLEEVLEALPFAPRNGVPVTAIQVCAKAYTCRSANLSKCAL
jgi:hypothetical protein